MGFLFRASLGLLLGQLVVTNGHERSPEELLQQPNLDSSLASLMRRQSPEELLQTYSLEKNRNADGDEINANRDDRMVNQAQQSTRDMIAEWEREQEWARSHQVKPSSIINVATTDAEASATARNHANMWTGNEVAMQSGSAEQEAATKSAKKASGQLLREALAEQRDLVADDANSVRVAKEVDSKLRREGAAEQASVTEEDGKVVAEAASAASKTNLGASSENLEGEELKAAELARSKAQRISQEAVGAIGDDAKAAESAAQSGASMAEASAHQANLDGSRVLAAAKGSATQLVHEADAHLGAASDMAEEARIARMSKEAMVDDIAAATSQQTSVGEEIAQQVKAAKAIERRLAKTVQDPAKGDTKSIAASKAMELDESSYEQQMSADAKKANDAALASALNVAPNPSVDEARAIKAAKALNEHMEQAASFAGDEDWKATSAAKKEQPKVVPPTAEDAKAKFDAEASAADLNKDAITSAASEDAKAASAAKQTSLASVAEASAEQRNVVEDSIKVQHHNKNRALSAVRNMEEDDWSSKKNEKLYWERVNELIKPTPAPTPAPTTWMLDIGRGLPDELDDLSSPALKYGESPSLAEIGDSQASSEDDALNAMLNPMKRGLEALRKTTRARSSTLELSASPVSLYSGHKNSQVDVKIDKAMDEAKQIYEQEVERLKQAKEQALSKAHADFEAAAQRREVRRGPASPVYKSEPFHQMLEKIREDATKQVDMEWNKQHRGNMHLLIPEDSLALTSKQGNKALRVEEKVKEYYKEVKAKPSTVLASEKASEAIKLASQTLNSVQPVKPSRQALEESNKHWKQATAKASSAANDFFQKALEDTKKYIHSLETKPIVEVKPNH